MRRLVLLSVAAFGVFVGQACGGATENAEGLPDSGTSEDAGAIGDETAVSETSDPEDTAVAVDDSAALDSTSPDSPPGDSGSSADSAVTADTAVADTAVVDATKPITWCDVQPWLTTSCVSCHASVAPKLGSIADLKATSTVDALATVGERSVLRMRATTSPMPPGGGLLTQAAQLEAWIKGGYADCPSGDAGGPTDSGGVTDTAPPPVVCTSGTKWTSSLYTGSSRMDPGMDCNACHKTSAPSRVYTLIGTVYPTLHEPDGCNGASGTSTTFANVRVVATDSIGATVTLTVNSAGNFMTRSIFTWPVTVKVTNGTKTNPMVTKLPDASWGSCNSCHTASGTSGAPGRIYAP